MLSLTSSLCPLCQTLASPLVATRDYLIKKGASPEFGVCVCPKCQMGFSVPTMTNEELSPYYPEEYECHNGKKGLWDLLQSFKHRADYRAIKRLVPEVKNPAIFEFGAGEGRFLSVAKSFGARVSGQEPGLGARKRAKDEYGVFLDSGFAEEVNFSERYDVIVMRHVLEHVQQPVLVLEKILKEGLNPGGILFVKVPNLRSWEQKVFRNYWFNLELPRHRFHFTDRGMKALLGRVGFKDVKVKHERICSSTMKSLLYLQKHSPNFVTRLALTPYAFLPAGFRLVLAQLLCEALFFLPAGRMIVVAQKPRI